jgi:hypothetical protein
MLKPTANFKLSKQTKRFMATMVDPVKRNSFKNDMIQAELASAIAPKREPRKEGGGRPGAQGTTHSGNNGGTSGAWTSNDSTPAA